MSYYKKRKVNYLYLLKCNEYYKIGVSDNIQCRIDALQTGNPYKISLKYKWLPKDAYRAEKIIHEVLKHKNHRSEWFILDDIDIKKMNEILYYLGDL